MTKRLGTPEEYAFVNDMADFVLDFKRRRSDLGLTQATIGSELGKLYGKEFSHATVSRFENLELSLRNTCNVKPFLEKWINDYEELQKNSQGAGPFSFPQADEALLKMLGDQKKDRETMSAGKQEVLEQFYFKNPRPFTRDVNRLSQELDLCKEVVRVWFRNRQAKDMPKAQEATANESSQEPSTSQKSPQDSSHSESSPSPSSESEAEVLEDE